MLSDPRGARLSVQQPGAYRSAFPPRRGPGAALTLNFDLDISGRESRRERRSAIRSRGDNRFLDTPRTRLPLHRR